MTKRENRNIKKEGKNDIERNIYIYKDIERRKET